MKKRLALAAVAAGAAAARWRAKPHPLAGQRVWIVGASSGIGAALAHEMLARGAHVAISARRVERLREVAAQAPPNRCHIVPLDVTDPAATLAAAEQARAVLSGSGGPGGLDLVVHCAGKGSPSQVGGWDREAFADTVNLNLHGMNNLLAAVLPILVQQQRGHLVGIASVAGFRGLPGAETYSATKAAQIALLEGLRASLRPQGVRVTTVCPGFVHTELTAVNEFPMPFVIEADHSARAICDGLERGQLEIVFPWQMALGMKAARWLPVRLWAWLLGNRRYVELAHRRRGMPAG